MKKLSAFVGFLVLAVSVIGISFYSLQKSGIFIDAFLSSKTAAATEVLNLDKQIESSDPKDINGERFYLLNRIDDFIINSISGNNFTIKPYLLIKVRLDKVLKEISSEEIPERKIKLWYLYNMGVIAKTNNKVVAFDVPNSAIYPNSAGFTKHIDILIISHLHADHFDASVVREALKNGVIVVVPDDGEVAKYGFKSDKLVVAKPNEEIDLGGVEIIGYPSIHSSGYDKTVYWFLVKLNGKTLLHTGDGSNFDYHPGFSNNSVDVFLAHFSDDKDAETMSGFVKPKIVLPLHILELGHGSEIVDYMMYKNTMEEDINGYWKHNQKAKFIPLVWGESIEI